MMIFEGKRLKRIAGAVAFLSFIAFAGYALGGATFSRVKSWTSGETLTASDLNTEFNNILNNLTPAGVDDESSNATAMQATADPYPGSVASLATSLQGEIQRLRYSIAQITGKTYWYQDPDIDLTDPIKGDGTAGRVLRSILLVIADGTNATTIKPSSASIWNGDTNAAENNLGKGGDTGVFALNAGGSALTLQNAGISGDAVAVLSSSIRYNFSNTALTAVVGKTASGIDIGVANAATGADLDLTTLVDTGLIQIYVTYLTSQ